MILCPSENIRFEYLGPKSAPRNHRSSATFGVVIIGVSAIQNFSVVDMSSFSVILSLTRFRILLLRSASEDRTLYAILILLASDIQWLLFVVRALSTD